MVLEEKNMFDISNFEQWMYSSLYNGRIQTCVQYQKAFGGSVTVSAVA